MERQGRLLPDAAMTAALQSLTEPQRAAVMHVEGPLLILAGPGSGKTRVVTHRIAYLLQQGIHPRNIVALTFTNKAADEMRRRVERLAPGQPVWLGTFHRFCARLLRRYAPVVGLGENFSIYDTDDSRQLLRLAIEEEKIELTHATPDAVAHAISWAKNNLITAEKYPETTLRHSALAGVVERVYPAYQRALLRANAVDFDDLLMHVAQLLRGNPEVRSELDERNRYILVDEYQDTNLAQYAIVRALSVDYPNLAVTGDPDQSIYGWRGANLSNILEFERDFPSVKVVRLEQNYRSTKGILRVADALIRHNVRRKEKDLWTDNDEGDRVRLCAYPSERDESDHIATTIAEQIREGVRRPRDFAIFYRTNALSRQLEHSLRDQVVPYQIVNGLEFYQRKEIKDVLAYLHLVNNPRSDVALLRVINTPTRGIGKATITRLQEFASGKNCSLLEAARQAGVVEGIGKKSALAVAKFVSLYDRLGLAATAMVEELVGLVFSETGYLEVLQNSENEDDQDRLANLQELLTAAREFDNHNPEGSRLEQFLEESSLVADTDAWESESDKVTLMTMHAAKGLEFPAVFIVACEKGILPHQRSMHDEEKLEEERRLFFVGITRAMEDLQISYANYRMFRGVRAPTIPSDFLMELPRKEMEQTESLQTRNQRFEWDHGHPADDFEAPPAEDDFAQIDPEDMPRKPSPAKVRAALQTAADLLRSGVVRKKTDLAAFRHGMLVEHDEYGYGHIIALAGEGVRRTATVRFLTGEEKKFRLLHAPLNPAEEQ